MTTVVIYQCLSQTEASALLTLGIDGLLTLTVHQTRLLAGPRGVLRKLQIPETSPDAPFICNCTSIICLN